MLTITLSSADGDMTERQPSYQVTVYDTLRLAELLQPHMVSVQGDSGVPGRC